MKKDVLESNKADIHNFMDYQFAAKVMKEFPPLIKIFNKLLPALYDKRDYTAVAHVIQAVEESRALLKMQYEHYRGVYEKKGKVNEQG